MKAAYRYFQETTKHTRKATNKITLGELNSANKAKIRLKPRPARPAPQAAPTFTDEEKALLGLIERGEIGALIAHYAPPVEW